MITVVILRMNEVITWLLAEVDVQPAVPSSETCETLEKVKTLKIYFFIFLIILSACRTFGTKTSDVSTLIGTELSQTVSVISCEKWSLPKEILGVQDVRLVKDKTKKAEVLWWSLIDRKGRLSYWPQDLSKKVASDFNFDLDEAAKLQQDLGPAYFLTTFSFEESTVMASYLKKESGSQLAIEFRETSEFTKIGELNLNIPSHRYLEAGSSQGFFWLRVHTSTDEDLLYLWRMKKASSSIEAKIDWILQPSDSKFSLNVDDQLLVHAGGVWRFRFLQNDSHSSSMNLSALPYSLLGEKGSASPQILDLPLAKRIEDIFLSSLSGKILVSYFDGDSLTGDANFRSQVIETRHNAAWVLSPDQSLNIAQTHFHLGSIHSFEHQTESYIAFSRRLSDESELVLLGYSQDGHFLGEKVFQGLPERSRLSEIFTDSNSRSNVIYAVVEAGLRASKRYELCQLADH